MSLSEGRTREGGNGGRGGGGLWHRSQTEKNEDRGTPSDIKISFSRVTKISKEDTLFNNNLFIH